MPTLIVSFHCMCLFVPDNTKNSMHVLMPAIHGNGNGHRTHAAGPEQHVVRMLHRSFSKQPQGRSMDGLELVLYGTGPIDLELNHAAMAAPELPDLTTLTKKTVNPSLLSSRKPAGVGARVTFRAGRATERDADPFLYTLGGVRDRILANTVTWVIPGVRDRLTWVSLGGSTTTPPIRRLSELQPEASGIYRINIRHETVRTLPGGRGPLLTVKEMQEHFAAYYSLLDPTLLPSPTKPQDGFLLPQRQAAGGGGGVQCETAMARVVL